MTLKNNKRLEDIFLKEDKPLREISEFNDRGFEYLIEIGERNSVPWKSMAFVAVLGAIQIIAGAFLVPSGLGSTYGMGLLTEGLADIFYAGTLYTTREFTFSAYGTQKLISLAVSLISAGFTTSLGTSGHLVGETIEQVEVRAIQSGKDVVYSQLKELLNKSTNLANVTI